VMGENNQTLRHDDSEIEPYELPKEWCISKISNLCTQPQYGYTTKASDKGDLKLLRTTDITKGKIDWNLVPFCSTNPDDPDKYLLKEGDIVISRAGSVGFSCPLEKPEDSVFASYLIRFRPYIDKKFFKYFLDSPLYWREISEKKLGIAVPNVNANKLKLIPLPVPPLPEQQRIVSKLEELFSELDKGIESFKTAREQLKVYRQAGLKHAFEGRLTEEWRKTHAGELEPAEMLLEKIKAEREHRYRQQLDDWKRAVKTWETRGKAGKKPTKPGKPKELPPLTEEELSELPKLPGCYLYSYLAALGDLARGKSKHRPRNDPKLFGGKYPFIQTSEVKAANQKICSHSQTYSETGLAQSRLWPKGTLCITIAANIAETAFLGIEACVPDSIVGFTGFPEIANSEYIEFFIRFARKKIEAYAPATAQKNINLTTLENLIIPYCSINK